VALVVAMDASSVFFLRAISSSSYAEVQQIQIDNVSME